MSNNQNYNYHEPPPADYVDPEGRVNDAGYTEIMVYSDSGADVYCVEVARDRWDRHFIWWSPLPPTPPQPPISRRYASVEYLTDCRGMRGRVIDMTDGSIVADNIVGMAAAKFIADALEGRDG